MLMLGDSENEGERMNFWNTVNNNLCSLSEKGKAASIFKYSGG